MMLWRSQLVYRMAAALLAAMTLHGQPLGSISGTVIDSVSGAALAGVKVSLEFGSKSAVSDAEGRFKIGELQAGNLWLDWEKTGYASSKSQSNVSIRLDAGQNITGFVLALMPEASISGKVQTIGGEAMEANVELAHADSGISVASAKTTSGHFQLRGLAPGKYRLSARPSAVRGKWLPLTYFPNSLSRAESELILVAQGESRTGLNVEIQDPKLFHIEGRFGRELAPNEKLLGSADSAEGEPRGIARSLILDSTGRFSAELPNGEYRLKIMTFFQREQQPLVLGSTYLKVNNSGVENVVIPATPLASVRGRFRWANPQTTQPITATFQLNPIGGLGILQKVQKDANGWLSAPRVSPDIYSLLIGDLPKGTYVASIRAGAKDITETGLDLSPGAAIDVEIILADDPGIVTGKLIGAGKQPFAGGRISFSPVTVHRAARQLRFQHAFAGVDGEFSLPDLAPGEYTVQAHGNMHRSTPLTLRVLPGSRQNIVLDMR